MREREDREDIVALDKRHVWHPYTAMEGYIAEGDPIVAVTAEGPWITDHDGRRYFDANSSWWTANLGHRHPSLIAALTQQAQRLTHVAYGDCVHDQAAKLAAELCALAPKGLSRVFFTDDGSTAVEAAVKLCAQHFRQRGRRGTPKFVALSAGFHGETTGATSLGGIEAFTRPFEGIRFEVVHVTVPMGDGREGDEWARALGDLEEVFDKHRDIAAVVVEPIVQGAAGMKIHPKEYLTALRELTRTHGVLLVADEVFTGLYRTGPRWACDHANVTPDLLCLSKALSAGVLPFGAVLANEEVFAGFLGSRDRAFLYGHTYFGNPLGCAVARAALAVYQDEDIALNVARSAPMIAARFAKLATRKGVSAHRAIGMIGAIDLGQQGYLADDGRRVFDAARKRGVCLRPLGDTVYVAPPLNTTESDLRWLLDVVEESVDEALGLA